jgi:phospholipase C
MERSLFGLTAMVLAAVLCGCGGMQGSGGAPGGFPGVSPGFSQTTSSGSPIQHIVIMVQEARGFNAIFGTTKIAKARAGKGKHAHIITIRLRKVGFNAKGPSKTLYDAYLRDLGNGKMDGFYEENGRVAYEYLDPAVIRPYSAISSDYAVADHMFETQGSGDFTAHQDLIRGGTEVSSKASVIDIPDLVPWGCDAPPGTTTSLITTRGRYEANHGPFPCFTYDTLQTRFDRESISWKYYVPSSRSDVSLSWNAFAAIGAVADNKREWNAHISSPETNVLSDIADGALPAVSWVIPSAPNSDLPNYPHASGGPSWVATVVNAVGQSKYWDSTAIVIVWDDWGGFYDPVPPPNRDDQGGPGFRVPMLVVSPYTPQGYVSHTVYGFGSIIRFVEETFGLKRLGTTDETSNSMTNMFDFNQSPRPFEQIPSK